jgi:hypothetical protein
MRTKRAQRGTPVWRGSARGLALPLLLACNTAASSAWLVTQDCSVGIPPEQAQAGNIPPVSQRLTTQLTATGAGFYLRNFSLGPIAGFSCVAVPFQVVAHYTERDATEAPGARPVLARGIELEPFECRATDGRTYLLAGTGQADLRSAFINMTFSAWLSAGQATLTCSTRFVQVAAASDAGVAPLLDPAPFEPAAGEVAPPFDDGMPDLPPDPAP